MEIISIKKFTVGQVLCYGCDKELDLGYIRRVELEGGKAVYVCRNCCDKLAKICGIEVEEISKPDIDDCNRCLIRYKCFTTREERE